MESTLNDTDDLFRNFAFFARLEQSLCEMENFGEPPTRFFAYFIKT